MGAANTPAQCAPFAKYSMYRKGEANSQTESGTGTPLRRYDGTYMETQIEPCVKGARRRQNLAHSKSSSFDGMSCPLLIAPSLRLVGTRRLSTRRTKRLSEHVRKLS